MVTERSRSAKKIIIMKKLFLFFALTAVVITTSCSNDDDTSPEVTVFNITVSNTEFYTYDLGSFGDEEGAGINTQAEHFEISETNRNPETDQIIYTYQPKLDYNGSDFVEISRSYGFPDPTVSYIRINFTIID